MARVLGVSCQSHHREASHARSGGRKEPCSGGGEHKITLTPSSACIGQLGGHSPAAYYRQAPWKEIGERTIRVASGKFASGPWYAVLMGQGGMARGLVLYDSLETLNRIKQGDLTEEENARLTSALAVVFGKGGDLPAADLEAARQHGWRVAGPKAYPSAYRKEPGLSMRPPLAWELELLEGCLRAVPEFVRRRPQDDPAAEEVTVPVASGELKLVLAWVPEEEG